MSDDKLQRSGYQRVLEGIPLGYMCDLATELNEKGFKLTKGGHVKVLDADLPACFLGNGYVALTNVGEKVLADAHADLGKIFKSYDNFELVSKSLSDDKISELFGKVKDNGFKVDEMGRVMVEGVNLSAGFIGKDGVSIVNIGEEKLSEAHAKLREIYK